jgi:hypothetical protein
MVLKASSTSSLGDVVGALASEAFPCIFGVALMVETDMPCPQKTQKSKREGTKKMASEVGSRGMKRTRGSNHSGFYAELHGADRRLVLGFGSSGEAAEGNEFWWRRSVLAVDHR